MPHIHIDGASYECTPDETVLDCLDRHGVQVMSSCRVGVCQSCLVQAVDGTPPAAAQKGLRGTVAGQGFFLACSAYIDNDLTLDLSGASGREVRARVQSVDRMNDRIVRLRCEPESAVDYAAGQFMNLVGPEGDVRSYSIASIPSDTFLEFQVMLMLGGKVSTWVYTGLSTGDPITLIGPQGACYYTPDAKDQPMLLAGTGTGLAPLYGILRDALAQGHTGPIHLFHGSVRADGLYLVDELNAIANKHPNVHYYACALESSGGNDDGVAIQPIDQYVDERFPDLTGYRVFLCGHPDLVKQMQRNAFLNGADMGDIYTDAFLPAANTT